MRHFSRPTAQAVFFSLLTCLFSGITLAKDYEELEWTALMPEDDLAALLDPPEYLNEVKDGSNQDSVSAFNDATFEDEKVERFRKALNSVKTIPIFDNKAIRIPGFVVPLQQNEAQNVTEFFIVPYFGACLHMPPPPPNQIIHVSYENGLTLESLEQPFWFEGTVKIETRQRDLGTSAYALKLDRYEVYQ
ncbi:DUF3299 domain-containing protein [Aestuariibacter sp. A3R04]|uniref:DUF3299 domain-containing protein n=1 Tax=Aestuariibacter sp. A3R04 TaxID=2841571 RepID=UPI001C0913D0|nr:DUF3299 domain-containing protein [Aestuariibacter sp. A3R04]MBU3023462.1 DUF3299 domain-containing protein [Aestuariibacter sp. A3R04]